MKEAEYKFGEAPPASRWWWRGRLTMKAVPIFRQLISLGGDEWSGNWTDAVTDQLREEMRQFLESRPDLGITDLVHMTTLSDSTGRNFMNGHCPGGREVVGEAAARAGDGAGGRHPGTWRRARSR